MASYRERVEADLARWIEAGLVPESSRAAILAGLPQTRRLDAATALGWVGGVLLGVAMIAFIAANWEGLSRSARFAIVLGVFIAAAAGAAYASHRARPALANGLLTFASLVFAAAIGLTGQIFDIAGDPRAAVYGAGLAAVALALAGRATGPMVVALVLFANGDFFAGSRGFFGGDGADAPWLIVAAPLGAALALRWGSAALAHVSALGVIVACLWFAGRIEEDGAALLFLSIILGAFAYGARWLRERGRAFASVFYGWFAWGALALFAVSGYVDGDWGLLHRLVWLIGAGGLVALGRFDKHALVSAIGVLGLIGAVAALLTDLGLDLMAAAGLFFVAALIALIVGLALRGRAKA